jgi:uncharacterized membrane protein YraQ (UPF0718 family)
VKKRRNQLAQLGLALGFGLFVGLSFLCQFPPGAEMGHTFGTTLLAMLGLLPCAFILIALFEVWVKRETIERHLGEGCGARGYFWVLLLAGFTVGGLYVAFPVAVSLARKGAKLSIIFAYVGFAGVCRIPMVMFEVSFMGWLFTVVRMGVAIPLVIVTARLLGAALQRRGYQIEHQD